MVLRGDGSHEEMLLECFLPYLETGKLASLDEINDSDCLKNGGEWITKYYLPERQRMSDDFNRGLHRVFALPLLLIIGEDVNRFNITHAELVRPDSRLGGQTVWLDCDLDHWLESDLIPDDSYERLLWGRLLYFTNNFSKNKFAAVQPGLSTTFCGHTPTPSPTLIQSHLNIDTGAYLTLKPGDENDGYGLMLFDVKEACCFTASFFSVDILKLDFMLNPRP